MTTKRFPKEILVAVESPGNDDPYLVVCETPDQVAQKDATTAVGIYRLARVGKVTNVSTLK